jgi:hypothetical protein
VPPPAPRQSSARAVSPSRDDGDEGAGAQELFCNIDESLRATARRELLHALAFECFAV